MKLTNEQLRLASECCASDEDKCNVCPLNHLVTCKVHLIKQMHRYNEELIENDRKWAEMWADNQRKWEVAYDKLEAENAEQDEAILRALKQMGECRRQGMSEIANKLIEHFDNTEALTEMERDYIALEIMTVVHEMTEKNNV